MVSKASDLICEILGARNSQIKTANRCRNMVELGIRHAQVITNIKIQKYRINRADWHMKKEELKRLNTNTHILCTKKIAQYFTAAILTFCAVYCDNVIAETETRNAETTARQEGANNDLGYSRLTAYQPNYAIWQWSEEDDPTMEVHYSFRYLLSNENVSMRRLYFTYTGEFDFYLGTRESSPVINRLNNPAFHWRMKANREKRRKSIYFDWLDLAIEHKSNGQSISANERVEEPASSNFGEYTAELAFNSDDNEYIDSISRGTNYVSVETRFGMKRWKSIKFYARANILHFSEESEVHWGKYASKNVEIADFERLRFIAARQRSEDRPTWGLEWTIGDKLLATDSVNLWLETPIEMFSIRVPFYVRAHYGPMKELSNYSETESSFGVGIQFN